MGAILKSKTHLLNTFFIFWAVFCAFGFKVFKEFYYDPKKVFFEKIKKPLISCWFRICWKIWKKCTKKKLSAKKVWRTWVKVKKGHISVTFLLITFLVHFFKTFSTDSKSAWNSAFLIPILNFEKKSFFALVSTFCAGNGSKKRKIFFYECVMEFY